MPDAAALAARFAPILWVHETDHFLPEDARDLFTAATIRLTKHRDPIRDIGSLEELLETPADQNTPDHYLDIAELNLWETTVDPDWAAIIGGIGAQGFGRVREGACKGLGNNRYVNTGWYNPARVRTYRPRMYWQFTDGVTVPDGVPGVAAGAYGVLQYFNWTIYNDHFNQHEGDWDATLQLLLSPAGEAVAATYSFHEHTWLVAPADGTAPIRDWLGGWPDLETLGRRTAERDLPPWHATPGGDGAVHPWNVIATGSHGGYPTPGHMDFEAAVPTVPGEIEGGSIRLSSDDRAIGQTCLYPAWSVSETALRDQLRAGGLSDARLRPIGYALDQLEQVDPERGFAAWRGHWGECVPSPSWNGPVGPTHQAKWQPGSDAWVKYLAKANDFSATLQQIGRATHEVRPHDMT